VFTLFPLVVWKNLPPCLTTHISVNSSESHTEKLTKDYRCGRHLLPISGEDLGS
jgi:hypothetical protein